MVEPPDQLHLRLQRDPGAGLDLATDEIDQRPDVVRGGPVAGDDDGSAAKWHVHTRRTAGDWGTVVSYTGANAQGAWDTERLRFNDFHGALGWKGVDDDLVVSLTYARQRDNYDEQNFLQEYEAEDPDFVVANSQEEAEAIFDAQNRGAAERAFGQLGHMKSLYAPGSILNTYVGDVWRGQIVHNAYLDDDTTVIVVSDHGSQPMSGGIGLNEWLADNGWLALKGPKPAQPTPLIVDVRAPIERQEKRIPGSAGIPLTQLADRLGDLPADRPLLVHCAGGYRSSIAASLLQRHGFTAGEIAGGIAAWEAGRLPLEFGSS